MAAENSKFEVYIQVFKNSYGTSSDPIYLASAPGRINVIGEHTDYNHGFVFPAGLDRHMYLFFRPRKDTKVRVIAVDLNGETGEADTRDINVSRDKKILPRFLHYIMGPSQFLKEHMHGKPLLGFDGVLTSTIPNGGGVSSSSALCVAAASAFRSVNEHSLSGLSKIDFLMSICEGEWLWSGVRGGIMDQFASVNAKKGHMFVLDCRKGEVHSQYGHIPIPENLCLIVANTNVKHDLVGTPYNDRRRSCEQAALAVQKNYPEKKITHLRDVTIDMLNASKGGMNDEAYKRATHAILEDIRTIKCAQALLRGDLHTAGELVNQSHFSLQKVYEVSCNELDTMAEIARSQLGCYGARMMGGGFGGCCIILANPNKASNIVSELGREYKQRCGRDASILITQPGEGAEVRLMAGSKL